MNIVKCPPPKLEDEEKWDLSFRNFVYDCLKKEPKERPTADELLERHKAFFEQAVTTDVLAKELLVGMPKLEERVFIYLPIY
jgi:serine/threonine protein kinase